MPENIEKKIFAILSVSWSHFVDHFIPFQENILAITALAKERQSNPRILNEYYRSSRVIYEHGLVLMKVNLLDTKENDFDRIEASIASRSVEVRTKLGKCGKRYNWLIPFNRSIPLAPMLLIVDTIVSKWKSSLKIIPSRSFPHRVIRAQWIEPCIQKSNKYATLDKSQICVRSDICLLVFVNIKDFSNSRAGRTKAAMPKKC